MNAVVRSVSCALASCFFLTYPLEQYAQKRQWRFAGTGFIGSFAGVLCAPFLPLDPLRCVLSLLGALLISVVVSDIAEEHYGTKDDHRIVIDEWVGYLVTIALLPPTPLFWGVGFVVFRTLDTLKPLGIHRLGRWPGGWGVVLDDIAAGLLGNVLLRLLLLVS